MKALEKIEKRTTKKRRPEFRPGDQVKVHFRISEGGRERVQVFEGIVLQRRGKTSGASFTVRKVSFGVGVERIFPLHSPRIEKIDIVRRGKVRRAKIYYLRELAEKASRLKERRLRAGAAASAPEVEDDSAPAAAASAPSSARGVAAD